MRYRLLATSGLAACLALTAAACSSSPSSPSASSPATTAPASSAPEDAGAEDGGAEVAGDDADDDDGLELHAAAVSARQAARPEVASRRYFMISPLRYLEGCRQVTVTTTESQPVAPLG